MAADNWRASYQTDSTMGKRWQTDANRWKVMLSQINDTRPETILGYGLGQLLRGAWEHRKRKADENNNSDLFGNKNTQVNSSNGTFTIGGIDPRTTTVDEGQTIYGIAPQKGLLGANFGIGQKQTTQEQPNGQTTTTTETYALNPNDYAIAAPERLTLNEMAARQILGDNDPYGLYSKKNPLGNINLRY